LICTSLGGLIEEPLDGLNIHLAVDLLEDIVALLEAMEHGDFNE
jgi:hypothetical protein